jgi:hypothetical protein
VCVQDEPKNLAGRINVMLRNHQPRVIGLSTKNLKSLRSDNFGQ